MSRYKTRHTTNEVPQVDVRKLARDGYVQPDTDCLSLDTAWVGITWTACNIGGHRPWFICPRCGDRRAILYKVREFGCRVCSSLYYATQRAGSSRRLSTHVETMQNIRTSLGGVASITSPFPDKPKGMHWRTYYRAWVRYSEANQRHVSVWAGYLNLARLC